MSRLVVGPFNRVEGDLEVRLDISEGQVQSARVVSPMYRGFETIMQDRSPIDALAITPRICGICSISQSVGAARAIANFAGAEAPLNGQYATQLAHACENLVDHLTHFYLFFMPDFTRDSYASRSWYSEAMERFQIPKGTSRNAAMAARAKFLHVTGIIAGKWPHTLAIQPGGTTSPLDQGERIRLIAAIDGYRRFLEKTIFGDQLDRFLNIKTLDQLMEWADEHALKGDLPFFLSICEDLNLWEAGQGGEHFMSFGAYSVEGRLSLKDGVRTGVALTSINQQLITEDNSFALFEGPVAHPFADVSEAAPDKEVAYSWCRAPRYRNAPVEVGAFARQLVDGVDLLEDICKRHGSSVGSRVLARWVETARVIMLMQTWSMALEPDGVYFADTALPSEGSGVGLTEAARGALGHWMTVEKGLVQTYQIIAPTTWNFSPRDEAGVPGPLESALVGATVQEGEKTPLSVQHIVRSFDPCMVCTAH